MVQEHQKALAIIYQKYSLLDPIAGKPSFGLEEWKVSHIDSPRSLTVGLSRDNDVGGASVVRILSVWVWIGRLSCVELSRKIVVGGPKIPRGCPLTIFFQRNFVDLSICVPTVLLFTSLCKKGIDSVVSG